MKKQVMQKTNPINVARFILKSPRRVIELIHKVGERLFDRSSTLKNEELDKWLKDNSQDLEKHLMNLDPALWEETKLFHLNFEKQAAEKLKSVPFKMGGGGHYLLLYFLVRRLKPNVIVETGVSSGFSTQAILKAIQLNNKGRLYSSDFPFFRVKDPEKYIGILVDEDLKKDWYLNVEGDRVALPEICRMVDHIDIFHYDSDKSYKGREFAFRTIKPKLTEKSLVIFDDIHNNTHFYDYVTKNNIKDYQVYFFINKYVGFLGKFE